MLLFKLLKSIPLYSIVYIIEVLCVLCRRMQDWVAERLGGLLVSIRLHVAGFYCFMTCVFGWPIFVYAFPFNVIVVGPAAVYICYFLYSGGSLAGYIVEEAAPSLQLLFQPHNKRLREDAEREMLLIDPGEHVDEDTGRTEDVHELEEILMDAGFASESKIEALLQKLESQNIHSILDMYEMQTSDYKELGISIGDRIRIQRKLNEIFDK